MLEINYIQENKAHVIAKLQKRNLSNAIELIENSLAINQKRKETQQTLDALSFQNNQIAKQIEQSLKEGGSTLEVLKQESKALKSQIKGLEVQLGHYKEALQQQLSEVPNLPHDQVPVGKNSEDNQVVYQVENVPVDTEQRRPHWELCAAYDIVDFELGNKLTGAGFPVYKGKGARLQRALVNFFLDEAMKVGYDEVQPPVLVNKESAYGTGQLPDKEGQMYALVHEPFYLIPTAEVPVTNLYRGQILAKEQLPIRHVAYTPCFRRESGSWGSHVRGLNRLHQFDKVELVEISLPSVSYQALERMRAYVEGLLQQLELPYRVLKLCSGDLGFASAMTYDMEVFSVGQNRWLEVSSISNFETYQAHRMQLKYKDQGNNQLLHTLNGSALALPRIMASLLELNFTGDKIKIPSVLTKYTNFDMNMANIVLLGPPGAGKGTQSDYILSLYNLRPIVPGNLMREHISQGTEIGKTLSQYINDGKLAPHEVVMRLVEEQITLHRSGFKFLFDGFPRAIAQAISLDELLPKHGHQLDGVIFLDVPDEIVKARIKARAKVSGRADDQSDEKIATRLAIYHQETLPVVDYYEKQNKLYRVAGTGAVEDVFRRMNLVINELYHRNQ
eukprot:gene1055-1338_t